MGTQANASAEAISLPKGGGALQGIGETFSPDLHTGTGNFSIPIPLPAGRNGFGPQLTLGYSTGSGNGPFGLGWTLGVPMVSRKTSRGVPRYHDADPHAQDTFVLSGSEDLVPVPGAPEGSRRYRPRTEGLFARIDRHLGTDDVWEVQSRDGLVSRYGGTQDDGERAVVADPAGEGRVFSWHLTETVDPFGNRVRYEYLRDRGGDPARPWDQLYLRRIRYVDYFDGGGTRYLVSVDFTYEDRPDPFSDRRPGFEVRTRKRCTAIRVSTHAGVERPTTTYRLVYLDQRPELAFFRPRNGVSLLSRVVVTGHDGARTERLPPIELGYTRFEPEGRRFVPLAGTDLPARALGSGELEMVDLFGSGLPDLLEMDGTVRYWRNLGGGRFDRPRAMRAAPAGLRLGDPGVQLVDADGDGRADLLVTTGTQAGYFPLGQNGEWDERSYRAYPVAPSFSLADPEVRLVDLDGDGVTDALRAGTRLECFFSDPGRGWGETRYVDRGALEGLRDLSFADPRVRLADMSGDGLQDVVRVHGRGVDYWPSLGRGRWGGRVRMAGAPQLPADYDPRRLLLGDVDGDGAADLVYVGDGWVTLWINRSGNGWSEPVTVRGTPRVVDLHTVRLADVLGNGISGVLWSRETAAGPAALHFLDFTGGVKPYLLNETDNHLGSVTRIEYAPSTRYFLADHAAPATRWRTPLPFPVQVVARTQVLDRVSGGRMTTEYTYHHGYWDGEEREFRGFGRVDRRDTETFSRSRTGGLHGEVTATEVPEHAYAPPVETRTWFHQGAVSDGTGGWTGPRFEAEYWSEPWPGGPAAARLIPPCPRTAALLASLPARARRDALRTLRGQVLRTEVYALDGSEREGRPYTVTEPAHGVREEEPPTTGDARARIFFPHLLGTRTTEWERGEEPMTGFAFTDGYDAWGQPCRSLTVAVPRGRDPRADLEWPEPYLAVLKVTGYAAPEPGGRFLADRQAHVTEWELVDARGGTVAALRDAAFADDPAVARRVIGQTLHFYDGEPFRGLPLGRVGRTGARVRTEELALTPELTGEAYGESLPPWFAGEEADWSGYPAGFVTRAADAGYHRREPAEGSPVAGGWYVASLCQAYDFQGDEFSPRGLVRRRRDPLGAETHVRYDRHQLLPRKTTDPAGLVTRVHNDLRVLKPLRLRDVNGNRSGARYTPLGRVEAQWVAGRKGETVGDTPDRPSTRYVYDYTAFDERGEPVSVRTIRHAHHVLDAEAPADEADLTVETVEYTDGFGRLVQTRSHAPEVCFGEETWGDGVLDPDRARDAAEVAGTPAPEGEVRVVVSGWQRYDNKGRPVETYEPFFSRGWAFAPAVDAELGRSVVQEYDAPGRVVRSVRPDGAEERVVYGAPSDSPGAPARPTPWETLTYGPNDNAGRTHPAASAAYAHHRDTPAGAVLDGMGRTVVSVARTRDGADEASPVRELRSHTRYDARGQVLEMTDALGRTAASSVYDLLGNLLRQVSLDAGEAVTVVDAAGRVLETRDARGARVLRAHDALGRPSRVWASCAEGEPLGLRERIEYGDGGGPAQDPAERAAARGANSLGRATRHFDEAGLAEVVGYDFRGRTLERVRRTVRDDHLLAALADAAGDDWRLRPFRVDWTPPAGVPFEDHAAALLDPEGHATSLRHDALDRVRLLVAPAGADGRRRELRTRHDRAGTLRSVTLDGVPYVEHVAYSARGQRTLIAYGNGVMARYAYDRDTARLVRLRAERYVRPAGKPWTFRPAPGRDGAGVLQDLAYRYDLEGNLLLSVDRTPGCGVLDNPEAAGWVHADPELAALMVQGHALARRFTYDPLGRLVSATGREGADGAASPRPWNDAPRAGFGSGGHGTPDMENAPALSVLYAEEYAYDPAGNLAVLRHRTGSAQWTRRFGVGGRAPAAWAAEWTAHVQGHPWPAAPGNHLTHVGDDDPAAPQTHVYDAAGNLVRERLDRHFAWDHANRLVLFRRQTPAAGSTPEEDRWAEPSVCALYLYDAGGQRVKKLVRTQGGGVETTTYVEGVFEHQRWTRTDGSGGACTLLHVMDGQKRIAVVRDGDAHPDDGGPPVQYHLEDHLGSSAVTTDAAGTWINREEHTPFGETTFGSFARKRYRFTGKERDGESGLYHHGARYYLPWLCRWASCDPAGMVDGPNLYVYVRNSPLTYRDPTGMQAEGAVMETTDNIQARQSSQQSHSALNRLQERIEAHEASIDATGVGTYFGVKSSYARLNAAGQQRARERANRGKEEPVRGTPQETSCVDFVIEAVNDYYDQGVSDAATYAQFTQAFRDVMNDTLASDKRGTALANKLRDLDWTTVYYSADTRTDSDYGGVKKRGYGPALFGSNRLVGGVDVTVEIDHFVTNFSPASGSRTRKDTTGLDKLKQVPFAVGMGDWGMHTFILSYGEVYEVHWDKGPSSKAVFEKSSFEEFSKQWKSGVIAVPPKLWRD